jgi:hypothetical protein
MVVLPAAASMIAGCADSRMAANNADAQAEAPYQAGYGMSSNGPTTDLYTELFRNKARDDRNAPVATAAAGPVPQGQAAQGQPVTASNTVQRGQPVTAANAAQRGQPATTAANSVPPGQPAAVPVAQEEPPPQAVPTAYGISSNGPTTDLYTEIFGPRNHN